jgi:hypothetical protein
MYPSSQNRNWQRTELMHLRSLPEALAGFLRHLRDTV